VNQSSSADIAVPPRAPGASINRKLAPVPFICVLLLWLCPTQRASAEEIWLHDNTRIWGLVQRVTSEGKIGVLLTTGQESEIPLEDILSIRFLGRDPLLVQAGTQEFRFVNGGRMRAQVLGNEGDRLKVQTAIAGTQDLEFANLKGFVALPLAGFTGRKAEELIESEQSERSDSQDVVLDRQGGVYPGVVRGLKSTELLFDIDSLLQVKTFPLHYVKGIRLADGGRDAKTPWTGDVQVFLTARDGSIVQGKLSAIRLHKWELRPAWNPAAPIEVDLNEIALVQTLGGRAQYLSQLTPSAVREQTVLAPPQQFQMDRNCQGNAISIAGRRYEWGIGVHADSQLTFDVGARYQEFRAAAGLDTRAPAGGAVKFAVEGDGKILYESPVVHSSDASAHEISVPIPGIRKLTLRVMHAGNGDLGDVANWGSARVLRGAKDGGS
jgi:hypothetical protein